VLHLKDLLTVLPPGLKRVFENETRFEAPLWCRIRPNSAICAKTWQNMAQKRGLSRPILSERVKSCGRVRF